MIIIHIALALSSIIFASILLVRPSRAKFRLNYGFMASVVASGTYLVVADHVNILHTCLTGLLYLAVVAAMTKLASRRLAAAPTR